MVESFGEEPFTNTEIQTYMKKNHSDVTGSMDFSNLTIENKVALVKAAFSDENFAKKFPEIVLWLMIHPNTL